MYEPKRNFEVVWRKVVMTCQSCRMLEIFNVYCVGINDLDAVEIESCCILLISCCGQW